MDWLGHTLSVGRALGFNIELVKPERIAELHPFYNLDGVLGALHTPDDGHVDPSNVTMAMAMTAFCRYRMAECPAAGRQDFSTLQNHQHQSLR